MLLSRHLDKGFWTAAANVVKAFYGFAFVFWLMRVLPKEEFAHYILIQTAYLIASQLSVSFSFGAFVKYYHSDKSRLYLQSNGLFLFSVLAILVCLFFGIVNDWICAFFEITEKPYLFYFVPALFLASFGKLFTNELFKATHNIKAFFYTEVVYFVAMVIIVISFFTVRGNLTAGYVLASMVLAFAISSVVGAIYAWPDLLKKFKIHIAELKEAVAFNKFIFLISVSNHIFENIDIYIIAAFLEKEEVALFGGLKLFTRIFTMFRQAVGIIGFPAFARLHNENRMQDLRNLYEKGIYYSCVLLGIAVIGVILFADLIFDHVLVKYAGNGVYLRVFILLGLFVGWQTVSDNALYGLGKPQIIFYIRSLIAVLNLGFNLILIPMFGIWGAISTAIGTMILLAMTSTFYVQKDIHFTFSGIWQKRTDLYYFLMNTYKIRVTARKQ